MDQTTDTKPPYPICILPQPNYRERIKEEELWSLLNSLVIQRRGANEYKGKPLCPEIYGTHRAEMSVNLLGGKFEPNFVEFSPNKPKDLSEMVEFDGNYDHDADAFGLYVSIPSIHNGTFPALRKFPDKQSYDKVKDAILDEDKQVVENQQEEEARQRLAAVIKKHNSFRKDKEYPVRYLIQVMHRPTNANYWHCQIEIAEDCGGGKTVKKETAELQDKAFKALTNFLIIHTSFEYKSPIPKVKKEWYEKEPA